MWALAGAQQNERPREAQEGREAHEAREAQEGHEAHEAREQQELQEAEGSIRAALGAIQGDGRMQIAMREGRMNEPGTFLGVGVSEASGALSHQLKLKPGVGLVVDMVQPESPAAKAGVQQYDVLEKLDDQLLVNLPQLMTLVRMHKAGDSVTLTLIREGARQTVTANLADRRIDLAPGMPIKIRLNPNPHQENPQKQGDAKPKHKHADSDDDNEK
jgi:C-terminal processing protease CtpA/Prc